MKNFCNFAPDFMLVKSVKFWANALVLFIVKSGKFPREQVAKVHVFGREMFELV